MSEKKAPQDQDEDKDPNAHARMDASKDKSSYEGKNEHGQKKFIDSENEKVEKSLTAALGIPVEDKSNQGGPEEKPEDVLEGEDSSSDEGEEGEGLEEELFGDHELMADIGVEVIDMAFTFSAMAIAGDSDEQKFSVSAQRRNRIKKPLALLLKNREVSVSPEVMVLVMILTVYAPVMIKAVKVRAEKKKSAKKFAKNAKSLSELRREEIINQAKEYRASQANEAPIVNINREEKKPEEKPRTTRADREKLQDKAYLMKKQGKTYSEICAEMNISESTAIRYIKTAEKRAKKAKK